MLSNLNNPPYSGIDHRRGGLYLRFSQRLKVAGDPAVHQKGWRLAGRAAKEAHRQRASPRYPIHPPFWPTRRRTNGGYDTATCSCLSVASRRWGNEAGEMPPVAVLGDSGHWRISFETVDGRDIDTSPPAGHGENGSQEPHLVRLSPPNGVN